MDPLQDRLGNQVSHTLPISPLPVPYRAGRWAVTLYEHGIALQRGGRIRTFLFEEIRELAIRERELFKEATRCGVLWEVTVRSARDRLTFRLLSQTDLRDTAGAFLETVRACLAEMAGRRLRAGEPLAGKGWALTGGALQAAGQTVPLDMLSETELYGDRVAVWKAGEEMPYFSVPAHSTNALVLLDVLAARLPERAHRHHGLGRALFEKRTLLGAARGFRVHQGGIVKLSAFGRRQLLFAEVERMSCQTTRHYHNGVYTGTSFELRFQPGKGRPLKIKVRVRGSLHDLEQLRDRVAGLLADRLRERLDRESEAPWTDGVWLSRQGVRFARRRLIGRGEETAAAFSRDLRFSIDQGTLQLFVPGDPKPVLSIPCAAEGFYPGFVLFGRLAAEAAAPLRGTARV